MLKMWTVLESAYCRKWVSDNLSSWMFFETNKTLSIHSQLPHKHIKVFLWYSGFQRKSAYWKHIRIKVFIDIFNGMLTDSFTGQWQQLVKLKIVWKGKNKWWNISPSLDLQLSGHLVCIKSWFGKFPLEKQFN